MKKLIFTMLPIFMLAVIACGPQGSGTQQTKDSVAVDSTVSMKVWNPDSVKTAILNGSNDTVKYDLNGDGKIDASDVTAAINKK